MSLKIDSVVRIRPHFGIKQLDEGHVILLSEKKKVLLKGAPYVRLTPKLESRTPVWELVAGLKDEIPAEKLFFALDCLDREGLLIEGTAEISHEDVYWNLIDRNPTSAKENIGTALLSVTTVGLDQDFADLLVTELQQAGIQCVGDKQATLHVVLTDDYLNPELSAINQNLSKQNKNWIIAKPVGSTLWFGPLFKQHGPCWECMAGRLRENMYGQYAVSSDQLTNLRIPVSELAGARKIAAGFLCSSIVHWLGEGGESTLDQQLLTLNLANLDSARHQVLSDPGCSLCIDKSDNNTGTVQALELHKSIATDRKDAGYRVCDADETMQQLQPLISPLTGIVPCLEKAVSMETSHVYYARHTYRAPVGLSENRWIGKPSWACGKGASDIQARVSCVAEAVERYSCGYFGTEERTLARMDELENAISPTSILNFSDQQYDRREQTNLEGTGFNWVPMRFQEKTPIEWSPLQSLTDGNIHHIPTALCYMNYPLPEDHIFCRADANGCAAGNTIEEAILQGLFELVERDAVSLWWYNRIQRQGVNLESFDVNYFMDVKRELQGKGRALQVIDISSDLGIYTFAAASWREAGDKIYVGFGAHIDPAIGISRALNEVSQLTAYHDQGNVVPDPMFAKWLASSTIETDNYVTQLESTTLDASNYSLQLTGNLAEDIKHCVSGMAEKNINVLVCDTTRSNVGFPTVRVVAPGLRHFWARFGPGRLYDVPVAMNWLKEKKQEDELNPIPFPL